jgi:hypothetical protein
MSGNERIAMRIGKAMRSLAVAEINIINVIKCERLIPEEQEVLREVVGDIRKTEDKVREILGMVNLVS